MSDLTPLAMRTEIFTGFDSMWADRTPIQVPNVHFDRSKVSGAYVRVVLLGITSGESRLSHSVARDHFERRGTFTIVANVREGADTDEAYTLLDAAGAWLANSGLSTVMFSNVGTPVELGTDGTFFQVSLSAETIYFTDRAA